jgi:hypothetical protein
MTEKQEGWCFFGLFMGFVISLILCCKLHVYIPIFIMFLLLIVFGLYIVKTYTSINWESIKRSFYGTYKLLPEEIQLWENIKQKALKGYNEFCDECEKDPDYWSWPWMSPNLTHEERELVNKIHAIYFGKNYYLTDPIGVAQGDWAFYDDIKEKVKQ